MPVLMQEKCFVKCFGEGTNLVYQKYFVINICGIILCDMKKFINGRLVEEKIYAQFASVSAGDLENLKEMYSTMNHCTRTTSFKSKY